MRWSVALGFLCSWSIPAAFSAESQERYDIICDAGSTGTRMYLFKSVISEDAASGHEVMRVSTTKIGKKKPGLSAYADRPWQAWPPLLELFAKVRDKIPQEHWASTSVSVLGTAGMRSLPPEKVQPVYNAVRQGLVSSSAYVFSASEDMFRLRSLSGTEEGIFAMLSVNFLLGRLDHKLMSKKSPLLGILDLGGSSTQIAVLPHPATQDLFSADVRSYASYGMEQMRMRLDGHRVAAGEKTSPCYFRGHQTPESPGLLGTGDAQACRALLQEVLAAQRKECEAMATPDPECMPGSGGVADAGARGMEFFAVSGYLFVTDFARHWLGRFGESTGMGPALEAAGSRPSIEELEKAADELCRVDWLQVDHATAGGEAAGAHRYTDSSKAPHRCLELNYVTTLLRHLYGFSAGARVVTFEDEVDDNEVEWPLGALLKIRHEALTAKLASASRAAIHEL
mmetsp:Transcript_104962/g.185869  ORF Transcript_104962/g.185869 Transcript_104962/m.185869 type:complete len:454 (-) Transcript_104962:26-1387(-)